jgi:hypothetical protein
MKQKIIGMLVVMLSFSIMVSSAIAAVGTDVYDRGLLSMDTIELNGTCPFIFHRLYVRNPVTKVTFIRSSIIRFADADIVVNGGELNEHGSGVLLLICYIGEYDFHYDDKTLSIDGKALFIHVNMN